MSGLTDTMRKKKEKLELLRAKKAERDKANQERGINLTVGTAGSPTHFKSATLVCRRDVGSEPLPLCLLMVVYAAEKP